MRKTVKNSTVVHLQGGSNLIKISTVVDLLAGCRSCLVSNLLKISTVVDLMLLQVPAVVSNLLKISTVVDNRVCFIENLFQTYLKFLLL